MPTYRLRHRDQELVARTEGDGVVHLVDSGDEVRVSRSGEMTFQVDQNGKTVTAAAARVGNLWHVIMHGRLIEMEAQSDRDRLIMSLARSGVHTHAVQEVRAPMPSRIVRIDVNVGDEVSVGQSLIVLEAMKMENTLKASQNGTVTEVAIVSSKAVEKGALLLILK